MSDGGSEYSESTRKRKFENTVTLSWRNVSVTIERKVPSKWWERNKYEKVNVINNVSGMCESGVLLAIMGASGAGKSTLLAGLSRRIKSEPQGEIYVNAKSVTPELMTKISGFVPQRDYLIDSLTVAEHMDFMATLMMDRRIRAIHRRRRIYWLVSEFGLLKCAKTQLKHLSGGEMRRVSLAVQLLTDPPILFCDEPTTGLDSFAAGVILEHLRGFASRGKSVICTIHQPASGLFELFHRVILLANGRIAYSGPVPEVADYFKSVGLICPASYNPAEFYVQQLAVFPGREEECRMRNERLCNLFEESDRGKELDIDVIIEMNNTQRYIQRNSLKGNWSTYDSSTSSSDENVVFNFSTHMRISKPDRWTELYLLCWRSYKDGFRNYSDQLLRFFLFMVIALFITVPYINLMNNVDQSSIQNLQGFIYLIITEATFTYSYSVFHTFPAEFPIFLREISNGLYRPGSYYTSKILIALPKCVFEALIYSLFIFLVANLHGGWVGCAKFCCVVIVTCISATAYGTLMSAAFEDISTASLLSVPIEMLGVLFSGVFVQLIALAPYLSWMKYLSLFYYGQEALSILQWGLVDHIECPDDPMLPCYSTGDQILNKYGYHKEHYYLDFTGLVIMYVVCHLFGFLCIWKRSKQQSTY